MSQQVLSPLIYCMPALAPGPIVTHPARNEVKVYVKSETAPDGHGCGNHGGLQNRMRAFPGAPLDERGKTRITQGFRQTYSLAPGR